MNVIEGEISGIKSHGNLSVISINAGTGLLKSIVIETTKTAPHLDIGKRVKLLFKETEVILTNNAIDEISLENRLPVVVTAIEKGKLLSKISLQFEDWFINVIITDDSLGQMKLKVGANIYALIKTNEIMLSPC